MDAEQRFDEFDRVVADRRNLFAGLQPARHQIIGKAIGVALELGESDAPLTVGEGDPTGKARRRALQEIADRHPADPAGARHAAGCRQILHVVPSHISTAAVSSLSPCGRGDHNRPSRFSFIDFHS